MTDGDPRGEASNLERWAALAMETGAAQVAVFVSDPSAEAERVAQLLRAAGYLVADVPLSLLATRVEVQTPRVVLVDGDAAGAREAIASVRRMASDDPIDVILLGHERPEEGSVMAGFLSDGSAGFFARPVDATALVRKIESLTGIPGGAGLPPPSLAPRSTPPRSAAAVSVAERPPAALDRRSPLPSSGQPSNGPISARSPPSSGSGAGAPLSARSPRPAISISTTLSAELEALLAEADQRIGAQMANEAVPPTPEEEIEAVLPEALLAALDEPLEDDDDDAIVDAPRSRSELPADEVRGDPPMVYEEEAPGTSSGRQLTPAQIPPTGAPFVESLGVAATIAAPALADPGTAFVIPGAQVPYVGAVDLPDQEVAAAPEFDRRSPVASVSRMLGPGDAPRRLAEAIAARASGCLSYESEAGIRRIVLRDGDVVTAASSADDEALLAFLSARGDVRREQVKELVGRVPPFGRHAGAALIGHGLLRQDQLWPTLRAHAEWVLGRTLRVERGSSSLEAEAPGRLRQEPGVFGGSSGAEVLVEAVRRVVSPEEAARRLGGAGAVVTDGPSALLSECALDAAERGMIDAARGATLGDLTRGEAGADLAAVLYALALLGVIEVTPPAAPPRLGGLGRASSPPPADAVDALDAIAVRERVRARIDLVREADYFTLLGVARQATGYEVRRAYLELRRSFEPARILTPELADLEGDMRTIVSVLDEAYEILRDGARRERYRRALGDEG